MNFIIRSSHLIPGTVEIVDLRMVLCHQCLHTAQHFTLGFEKTTFNEACFLCNREWFERYKLYILKQPWLENILPRDVVYISGPVSGIKDNNFPAFYLMEQVLLQKKCRVLNPVRYEPGAMNLTYEQYMRRDIKMVCDATAMVALLGWSDSKGAIIEYSIADFLNIPVYHEIKL